MVDFGNRIKNLRIKHSLTQEQLAQKLNMTKSVISAYETGARMPSYDALVALSRIFHVTTDYLLGIDMRNTLDTSGLSQEEIHALHQLIRAMRNR